MLLNAEIKMSVQRMVCTGCGSETNATCNCGKPYLPAKRRAAEAIAANPQKSNRAIAEEIGVSEFSVRDARKSGAMDHAPEREGRDGKIYHLPQRQERDEASVEAELDRRSLAAAFLLRADQARQFAVYSGKITREAIAAAKQTATAWQTLVNQMEGTS